MSHAPRDRSAEVRDLEGAYDEAWCAGDLDGLLGCFAANAVIVNPRGEVAYGIDEIRQALGSFLAAEAAGSAHSSTVERISFVTDDVAVIDGRALVSQADGSSLDHAFTDVARRIDGQWRLVHIRGYGLQTHRASRG